MVIVIVIAALVVAGVWSYKDFDNRVQRSSAEHWEALYYGMASDNVDLRIQLEDSRQAYSALIGQRCQEWAGLKGRGC